MHSTVIKPYVDKICSNIDKRFGDSVGQVSLASQLFSPGVAVNMSREQQHEHVTTLSQFFKFDTKAACSEWTCFRNYIEKHKTEDAEQIFKSLLATDVGDSYPVLANLAAVTLVCPVGTAGMYSQSVW